MRLSRRRSVPSTPGPLCATAGGTRGASRRPQAARRPRLGIPLAGAAVAVLAACSGSGGATPTSSPAPAPGTRAAYIAAADRACTAAHTKLDSRPAPRNLADTVGYLDATIQVGSALEQQLRALTPPAADAAAASGLLDSFHGLIVKAQAARQQAASGDTTGTDSAIGRLVVEQARVSAAARDFGFTSCGIPAEPSPSTSAHPSAHS